MRSPRNCKPKGYHLLFASPSQHAYISCPQSTKQSKTKGHRQRPFVWAAGGTLFGVGVYISLHDPKPPKNNENRWKFGSRICLESCTNKNHTIWTLGTSKTMFSHWVGLHFSKFSASSKKYRKWFQNLIQNDPKINKNLVRMPSKKTRPKTCANKVQNEQTNDKESALSHGIWAQDRPLEPQILTYFW